MIMLWYGKLEGDGEVYTWGDARARKMNRPDTRTTFVPWQVDMPTTMAMGSGFLTQLSVGAHHALALFRTGTIELGNGVAECCCILTVRVAHVTAEGKMDRWRKFTLGRIVSALPGDWNSSSSNRSSNGELMRRTFVTRVTPLSPLVLVEILTSRVC